MKQKNNLKDGLLAVVPLSLSPFQFSNKAGIFLSSSLLTKSINISNSTQKTNRRKQQERYPFSDFKYPKQREICMQECNSKWYGADKL
jgi:hypothetical protein